MASSSSGLGLALVGLGAAAIIAAPFTGGTSLVATGAIWGPLIGTSIGLSTVLALGGAIAIGAGSALSAAAAQPEPASHVARQTATTSDPESPWVWVYGNVVVGSSVVWHGVGGSEDQWSGADFVIACHPCEELVAVQIGDWCFPIVTDPDGDTDYNGLGLILNTDQDITDAFPADWYVPVDDSPWWRNPQDDKNTPDRPHIGLKWNPGDQTDTDPWMADAGRFGTKYSGVARKFIGHTVVHMMTRVHSELGTSSWQEVLFQVKGKNDVQDYAGENPAYRNNTAYVFADYRRERWGLPVTDIVGINVGDTLEDVAAECADTTWSGAGGAARFTFDGTIRDDEEPVEVLRRICEHMAGGYSERGDQISLFAGTVKTAWADGPLTYNDLAEQGGASAISIVPLDEDNWANTLAVHRVVTRTDDEDGKIMLYGAMEPTVNDVTSSTYVTEDGGEVLRQDIKFSACTLARRAKFLAWIVLKQMRLGASMEIVAKKRASVLEKGDVVACNFPEFFPNGTKFQVAGKTMILGPDTFAVRLSLVRYEDAIYTPGTTPSEDAIGIVSRNRSAIMPLVTGLSATVTESQTKPNGKVVCTVAVGWDAITNILVKNTGDVVVAWRKSSGSWPAKSTTGAGDELYVEIPGLLQGTQYKFRARVRGQPSAGRTDPPVGPWSTELTFTPDSGFLDLDGPPASGAQGANQVINGNFERGNDGTWKLTGVSGTTATGTATIEETGGKYGPRHLRIQITGGSATQKYLVQHADDIYLPVSAGDWKVLHAAMARDSLDFVHPKVNILFYDADKAFVVAHNIIDGGAIFVTDPWPESRFIGKFQVPGDDLVAWCKIQCEGFLDDTAADQTVLFDGIALRDLIVMKSAKQTSQVDRTDDTWTNLATLDDFPGADEADIYFDGETEITFQGIVNGNVKRGTSNVSAPARAVARLRLEEVGVGTTSIVSQQKVAKMTVQDGTDVGSNGEIDDEGLTLQETLTPAAGHYKVHLEGRLLPTGVSNATAQFKTRWITIWKS